MGDRQPDWDLDRLRGDEAEEMVRRLRTDVLNGRVQVKRDDEALDTGNVYLEYTCRNAETGEYYLTNIATTSATAWAHVIGDLIIAAPTKDVRELARQAQRDGETRPCRRGSHPTRGAVFPVSGFVQALVHKSAHRRDAF